MMAYIDRSELNVKIEEELYLTKTAKSAFKRIVYNTPSADVSPVQHGRWEHDHYENCCDNFEIVKCSCCAHQAYAIAFYVKSGNYCPNCGAKMDLEESHDSD